MEDKKIALHDAKLTIKGWIASCKTPEQLGLITQFIGTIVYPNFLKEINDKKGSDDKMVLKCDLAESILELTDAITDRKNLLEVNNPVEYPNKLNEFT